ncbi:MAG: HigA family addiction module antitoxin [Nitrospinales bacterium]
MTKNWRDPIHPGEHLAEELREIGMNGNQFAKALNVPGNRIYQILNGDREITADTARRIGKFFGTGPEIWMNLQQKYDLEVAAKEGGDLKDIKTYKPPKQKNTAPGEARISGSA